MSSIKIFLKLVRKVSAERTGGASETEVRLMFVKSELLVVVNNPTIPDVVWEKGFNREPLKYVRIVQRIFTTDRFGSFGDRKISLVLVSYRGEEIGSMYVVKVPLLFRISVRESSMSHKYALL